MPPEPIDPALIFEDRSAGPGTHVIIIGVGSYPKLWGGTEEEPAVADGMDQLTAPLASGRTIARWFLEKFNNIERPLKSISLLLSDDTPSTFEHPKAMPSRPLPRATAQETVDAIQAWVTRASGDPENMTVFFFCGHGISTGEPILLLRDYGARPLNRFDGSLNLNDFISAMQTMIPGYQVFLVDACRVPVAVARSVLGKPHVGRSPVDPVSLDIRGGVPAKQSVHHSSSSLAPSYGRIRGASLYTEALIQGLDGGGAQPNLQFWVGTLGLQTALSAYVSRLASRENVEQQPELLRALQFKIHRPSDISVPLYVSCDPANALRHARIEARLGNSVSDFYDSDVHAVTEEWVAHLPMREHTIVAKFRQNPGFADEEFIQILMPPESVCPINCRPKP